VDPSGSVAYGVHRSSEFVHDQVSRGPASKNSVIFRGRPPFGQAWINAPSATVHWTDWAQTIRPSSPLRGSGRHIILARATQLRAADRRRG
jgi:hypothetical protein